MTQPLRRLRQFFRSEPSPCARELESLRQEFSALRSAVVALTEASTRRMESEGQEFANLRRRIDAAEEESARRMEFARQEIFLEIRAFRRADFIGSDLPATTPRIVAPERVDAMRRQGGLRLNIGCGHKPDPDRINVDMRELPGVEVIAHADDLPFGVDEVREIFSSHVLEHFPVEALRRTLLPAWVALLASGGELRAVVPDGQAMLEAHAQGRMDFETLRLVTFGAQEYDGDFHHTMFSPGSLAALMRDAGLRDVRVEAAARRNGLCFECQVVGIKP